MPSTDELKAALAVAELEEALVKAKATKAGPDRELKDRLRAARAEYRSRYRDGGPGVARPDPVRATARKEG